MKTIFLDRDGTINVEIDYLHQPELVQLEHTVGTAIARMNAAGFFVVVVTNQAGIARQYYGVDDLNAVNQRISELLEPFGAHVDAWYFCPHHPDVTGDCACRKPNTGMLTMAARDHHLDLASSWMIGDKLIDVQAGINAGCRSIMVTTGYGMAQQSLVPEGVPVVTRLNDAVDIIVESESV